MRYNDGSTIEPEKFHETKEELVNRFGGLSIIPKSQGIWEGSGIIYEEDNVIFQVDFEGDEADFFKDYKEILKKRFEQEEIYITLIDILRI